MAINIMFCLYASDLSTTVQGTQNTLAGLLDRVSTLERMNNLQRQQIDGMETTISGLETKGHGAGGDRLPADSPARRHTSTQQHHSHQTL